MNYKNQVSDEASISASTQLALDKKFKKSNVLIGAKYSSTLAENRLLAIALSKVDEAYLSEKGSPMVKITAKELTEFFHDSSRNIYKKLDPIARTMTGRIMGVTNPETKEFTYVSIISKAEYKKGVFYVTFNLEMQDLIINLKNRYTLLSLETLLSFKSVYAFRLYEILRSDSFKGNHNVQERIDGGYEVVLSLAELKLELGVIDAENEDAKKILASKRPDFDAVIDAAGNQKYVEWKDFRKKVILVAQKEINEKSDLRIDFEPVRSGRGGKTTAVKFIVRYIDIKSKMQDGLVIDSVAKEVSIEEQSLERQRIEKDIKEIKLLLGNQVSSYEAKEIYDAAQGDIQRVNKAVAVMNQSSQKIKNKVGFLISAIKNNYSTNGKADQAGGSRYENYTDEEWAALERKLLGYDR